MHSFCLQYWALFKDIFSKQNYFAVYDWKYTGLYPKSVLKQSAISFCFEKHVNSLPHWWYKSIPNHYHIYYKQISLLNSFITRKRHWSFHQTEKAPWFYKTKLLFWSLSTMELMSLYLRPRSGLFLIIIINFYRPACLQQQQLFL